MTSITASNSCWENPFCFASSYDVLHPVIDDFFMQSLIVYCEPNAKLRDTSLKQDGDVVSGLCEKCDLQIGCCVKFDNIFTSLHLLDVL